MEVYKTQNCCRSCGSSNIKELFDFGRTPLSDNLLTKEQLSEEEIFVPLTLILCEDCTLVQIKEEVDPNILFCQDYPYYSSVSRSLMAHFENSAKSIINKKGLGKDSYVIEAASNDGYLLRHFAEQNIPVLGIDPADGPAKVATDRGIDTLNTFFSKELAEELRTKEQKRADVFLANNVLAHVPDLNGFVEGISILLKEDGLAVIEAPYLLDLIEHCEFDTIYHQHLCYFSVTALQNLFNRHGLYLNDIEHVPVHGGTLRMFIEPTKNYSQTVISYLEKEKTLNIGSEGFYHEFTKRIKTIKKDLNGLLTDLKSQGKKIVGYGAAAKANTFMSYCNIGENYLDYIADLSKFKQGLFMSGNHLPIVHPDKLSEEVPDYVLIMAWNFAKEIIKQQDNYQKKGGKFIIPIPESTIV